MLRIYYFFSRGQPLFWWRRIIMPWYRPAQPVYVPRNSPWYTQLPATKQPNSTVPIYNRGGNRQCIPWIADRRAHWTTSQFSSGTQTLNNPGAGARPSWFQAHEDGPLSHYGQPRYGQRYNPGYVYGTDDQQAGGRANSVLSRSESVDRMYRAYNPYRP